MAEIIGVARSCPAPLSWDVSSWTFCDTSHRSFFSFPKGSKAGKALRIMAIPKPHFAFLNTCFSDVGWITFVLLTIIANVNYGTDKIEIKQRLA